MWNEHQSAFKLTSFLAFPILTIFVVKCSEKQVVSFDLCVVVIDVLTHHIHPLQWEKLAFISEILWHKDNFFSLCRDALYYYYLTCPFFPYLQCSFFFLSFQKYAAKESLHFAATYWQPSGCIIVLANMYTAALWLLCDNQPAALWSFIPSGWDFPPFTQTSTSPIGSSHIPVVDVCHTSTKEESSCCIYYVYIYQGVYHFLSYIYSENVFFYLMDESLLHFSIDLIIFHMSPRVE